MAPRDDGSTHVLEAVIMTTVMVASIAFVVTFDVPATQTGAARGALLQRVEDVLAILNDTPVEGSSLGNNELSVAMLMCMQNDCARLRDDLDALMPVGSHYGVYLQSADGLFPVYAPHEPAGEAVSARRLLEPAWSYQFMGTSQDVYNPFEDPLVVYALPVFSANPVHQGSSALRITANATRPDHAAYVFKGSAMTRALGPADEPASSAISLFFHAGDRAAQGARDVTAQTIDAGRLPTGAAVPFFARIEESGGGAVPAGTQLTIRMPHGWTASASQAANDADWLVVANATNKNGSAAASSVVAKLKHAVSSGGVDLAFTATYAGDATDEYAFHASLSAGAYAQAQLLVRADDHVAVPAYEVPTLVASVPRPMGVAATTTWTLAIASPDAVEVHRIEIEEEEGRDIFGGVVGVSGGGTWTRTGSKLVWTGDADVDHDAPLSLTFRVTSTGASSPAADRAPFVPAVSFGSYTGALSQQTSPGLHRGVFPPASGDYGGYDRDLDGRLVATHSLDSASVYRATALPGAVDYTVGLGVSIKDSVFGSEASVSERYVRPGQTLDLGIEVQSLLYELGALGLEPSVTLNIYPPWAGDARTPVVTTELYNGTLAKGSGTFRSLLDTNGDGALDTTSVGRLNTSVTVPTKWLYGPYVTEVSVSWLDVVSDPPLSLPLFREARVYDYFVVQPSSGALPSSPVYDVHLVGWFEDWG